MGLRTKLRSAPLRLATGAYILNSGMDKRGVDEGTAQYLHQGAVTAYPQLQAVEPQQFVKILAAVEIGLGSALLTPFVSKKLVGAALMGFSGSLLRMYLRTPGATKEGSVAPTTEGIAVAKDVWMFGIGASLLVDALFDRDEDDLDDED